MKPTFIKDSVMAGLYDAARCVNIPNVMVRGSKANEDTREVIAILLPVVVPIV
jgi:hypothetical protein